jgi:hypothetical protein
MKYRIRVAEAWARLSALGDRLETDQASHRRRLPQLPLPQASCVACMTRLRTLEWAMRRFRLALLLLLSIVVPLQGYAHVVLPEEHCPMEQKAVSAEGNAMAGHDCCPDADGAKKTGKAAKSCPFCQFLGQLIPVPSFGVAAQEASSSVRYPRAAGFSFSFDPSSTWRPPAPL